MPATPTRASEFQPDEIVEGRYHILRKLADGGMGTVFLAEHVLIKRRVAIKVLHAELAADLVMVRRFMNEASAAGTLGHPHIVESTDMGFTQAGLPYIVFEYLEGCVLTEEVYRVGGLPIRRALQIASQVASALDAAHDAKIVHLDLKSDNVFLIARGDALDHAKVLDFGISRFMEADVEKTQRGVLIGTPEFMAPEQITAPDMVDARADIYALGVLLYEMLSARRPYNNEDPRILLHRIVHEPPPALGRTVPPALEKLLFEGMLAKSPDHRLQTMRDVKIALDHIIEGLRTESSGAMRPVVEPAAITRPVAPRRARTAWLAIAAVVAALAGGGLWYAERQQRTSGAGDARAALEVDADKIATLLASEARAIHGRLDGLASAPMLRAAIETDAATVADMVADGQLFQPRSGETIELVQTGARRKQLLRLPPAPGAPSIIAANDGASGAPAPDVAATRFSAAGSRLIVTATAPVTTQAARVAGTLAIAAPIDLTLIGRLVARDAGAASLVGLEHPLVLAGDAAPTGGTPLMVPIVVDRELGVPPLQLLATITPVAGGHTLHTLQLASFGLAAALLSIFVLFSLVHAARR